MKKSGAIIKLFKRRGTLLWIFALLFTIASFMDFSTTQSFFNQVERFERQIHKRSELLEEFAREALEHDKEWFMEFDNFPSDMVLYRYVDDTLQSWINQFPIANDEIDFFPFGYRLNHLSSRAVTNTPLAYLVEGEQYLNLGSAWYLVNSYRERGQLIIAALLIRRDYPTENVALKNSVNSNLRLKKQHSIVPITYDEATIVRGRSGEPLFSVIRNLPTKGDETGTILRWVAIVFALMALFLNLWRNREVKDFLFFVAGIIVVRVIAVYQAKDLQGELQIFSPNIYADHGLLSSLGDLLINNLFIFLGALALFMIRDSLLTLYYKRSRHVRRALLLFLVVLALLLFSYIHSTLCSLIVNSTITMEPYRIDEISIYSVVVYFSYALLFTTITLVILLLKPHFSRTWRNIIYRRETLMLFIALASLYTLGVVGHFGAKKEYNRNRVITTRLAVERDLHLELHLKEYEKYIASDPTIYSFVTISNDIEVVNRTLEVVHNRLAESYFWTILQRYDMRAVVCLNNTLLIDPGWEELEHPYHCNSYYDREISRYGSQLGENSNFFFMSNPNGKISYLGLFPFVKGGYHFRLYIELESKFIGESIGFPQLLADYKGGESHSLPSGYSYGKYLGGRLVSNGGGFNYPVNGSSDLSLGYHIRREEGHLHFINKISEENTIVLSRQLRSAIPYLVSFSYLMLLYSLVIFSFLSIWGMGLNYTIPRNSFRWKMMFLIISSLVVALLALGAGSIWFSIRYFNDNLKVQMEEKLNSAQSALSYFSKYAKRYNDPNFNTLRLQEEMSRIASTAHIDINIYGGDGTLMRTTKSEVFDRYLLGNRIDHDAYREIRFNYKNQFINREKIGALTYYSLYSPLSNDEGELIAILNIPYFSRSSEFRGDASSIIAAIINIYILLLIAAVFVGIALSNSISRPLIEISHKMELLDISDMPEHINYTPRDELGILVAAYNNMVDDLNESTSRLAAAEREQAWREMARQIAHEIKNPLTPMRLSIQHMIRLKEQDVTGWENRFEALAHSLIEQIDILSEAAGEFASFSRFYSEELSKVDLAALIREQIVLFNTHDNISIKFNVMVEEREVMARKSQFTRVLVNIISNAIQAVEESSAGEILITLSREGNYYQIKVEDNGDGVPHAHVDKLFKPNFTTKSGGTGLGLAICRNIIEQSQGKIYYERSETLGGASFIIEIPAI